MSLKHLISATDIDYFTLKRVIETALLIGEMEEYEKGREILSRTLFPQKKKQKKIMVYTDAESLRTIVGAYDAIVLMGGRADFYQGPLSSFDGKTKGPKDEDLWSIVRTLCAYNYDGIIMRHDSVRGDSCFKTIVKHCEQARLPGSFISGGEGKIEHPLQMLADMCVITCYCYRELETGQLHLGIMGDVEDSRTAHSLVLAMAKYGGDIYLISPQENKFPEHIWEQAMVLNREAILLRGQPQSIYNPEDVINNSRFHLRRHDVADPYEVAHLLHVLYCIRLQKNLMPSQQQGNIEEWKTKYSRYWVRQPLLDRLDSKAIIHHPLPHWEEFLPEYDLEVGGRFKHWEGVKYGRLTKAAILLEIFNPYYNLRLEWDKARQGSF
jgi:aspartate carbamoyltransferase catalytic subunit